MKRSDSVLLESLLLVSDTVRLSTLFSSLSGFSLWGGEAVGSCLFQFLRTEVGLRWNFNYLIFLVDSLIFKLIISR